MSALHYRSMSGADRYFTFLSLSGDAIGRFEIVPPLDAAAGEDEQMAHILAHARVTECNELFARFYGRGVAEMVGLAMGDFVPADDEARLHGIREFLRARFRLVYLEEEHVLAEGQSRWISASALGAVEAGRLHDFWVCLREISERKRAERDRERAGRILEAVAFSAARFLQPGSWRDQADEVLARLGQAAQVARVFLADKEDLPGGSTRLVFRAAWDAPEMASILDDPRVRGGWLLEAVGLGRLAEELRAGRPVVTRVKDLTAAERVLPERMGSRAFAAVPIFANGEWWGLLGFGETRYDRDWSASEVEALKAAAPVIGAAVERERADEALRESEERFRGLSAASFEAIAITDRGSSWTGTSGSEKCSAAPSTSSRAARSTSSWPRRTGRSCGRTSPPAPRSPTSTGPCGATAPPFPWRSGPAPCRTAADRSASPRSATSPRACRPRSGSGAWKTTFAARPSSGGRPSTRSTSAS